MNERTEAHVELAETEVEQLPVVADTDGIVTLAPGIEDGAEVSEGDVLATIQSEEDDLETRH